MANASFNLDHLRQVHRAWSIGAAVLLVALWAVGLAASYQYTLRSEEVELHHRRRQLETSLMDASLREREALGDLVPSFLANQLAPNDIARLNRELAPWFSVLVTDQAHVPAFLPDETPEGPVGRRMKHSVRDEQGNWRTFTVLLREDGSALILEANRRVLLGPYLKSRFEALLFGPGAGYQLLSPEDARSWSDRGTSSPPGPPDFMAIRSERDHWEFLAMTRFLSEPGPPSGGRFMPHDGPPPGSPFLPDGPPPHLDGRGFGPGMGPPSEASPFLLVTVPKWPILAATLRTFALLLVAIGILVTALVFSLRTVQRKIVQDLALSRAKANFTAMVSHELKTPVTAIRMYAEMLRDGLITDEKESKEFVGTIASEAVRLQRLIENLLELGKVESGNRRFALEPMPLDVLLCEAVERAQSGNFGAGSVRIVPPPSGSRVLVDRDAATQALANLVHNALKYGGSLPEVDVEAIAAGERVVVEVRDRGPGIAPEHRERIFAPYVRLENEETRTSQGTGLGLALVKAYAEALRGSVEVMDRPGGGSVFRLSLVGVTEGDALEREAFDRRG